MSSNKMSSRAQVKKTKNQKVTDKTDKAMGDIKKIGIVSCCLIAILIVIGLFIDTDESYAAGFLEQLPSSFESNVNEYNGGSPGIGSMHTLIGADTSNPIALPWEFYGTDVTTGERLSFIYCVDRSKGMASGHIYTKGDSVKDNIIINDAGIAKSYPGLIYILQNDNIVGEGDANIPAGDNANYVNYYITQVAIWYYLDEVNGYDADSEYRNFTSEEKAVIDADQSFYANKVRELVTGALSYQAPTDDTASKDVIIDTNSITYNMYNDYVETSLIRPISSNTSFESYSVQLSGNINNVQIVDENGNPITGTIEASKGFKVRVPVSALQNNTFTLPLTIVGYFANGYDAYIYNPDDSNAQKALLGIIERPSTPTSITLQVPTINVPNTASNSFLVYGIGALVVIVGIILIIVANRKPKNAKR